MIILIPQLIASLLPSSLPPRNAIGQNIMRSLDVKRLLDFRVGSEDEIEQDCGGDEEGEEGIWRAAVSCVCKTSTC